MQISPRHPSWTVRPGRVLVSTEEAAATAWVQTQALWQHTGPSLEEGLGFRGFRFSDMSSIFFGDIMVPNIE